MYMQELLGKEAATQFYKDVAEAAPCVYKVPKP
jgi:hypothetical protein